MSRYLLRSIWFAHEAKTESCSEEKAHKKSNDLQDCDTTTSPLRYLFGMVSTQEYK